MMQPILLLFFACLGSGTWGQGPVEHEPIFLENLENHTVTQGRDVSFTCVVNHLGIYKVAWIKSDSKTILAVHTHLVAHNNRLSVTHNGHNTWRLKVSNVQKNDSGSYMCQINTDPMKSQMGHLEVVIPPDVLDTAGGKDYVTNEGGNLKLVCKATGVPEPNVTWKREDGRNIIIRQDGQNKEVVRQYEGEILHLTNVQRSEMGVYLCIASNGIPPSVSKRFIVQIHFHPMVKVPNQLVAAPLGSDVFIQCYVESSPKAMHSWTKESGEKLMNSSKYEMVEYPNNEYSLHMNLTIRNLDKRDFGAYACSSVNALGKAEGTIRLQELQLPKTTPPPMVYGGSSGGGRKPPVKQKPVLPPTKKPRRKSRPEWTTTPEPITFPPTRPIIFDEENEIDIESASSRLRAGLLKIVIVLLTLLFIC